MSTETQRQSAKEKAVLLALQHGIDQTGFSNIWYEERRINNSYFSEREL